MQYAEVEKARLRKIQEEDEKRAVCMTFKNDSEYEYECIVRLMRLMMVVVIV